MSTEEIREIIQEVHPELREDFKAMIRGDWFSPEFEAIFNRSLRLQKQMEKVLRLIGLFGDLDL